MDDTRSPQQQRDHWLARLSDDDVHDVAFHLRLSRSQLEGATGPERLRRLYDTAIHYGQFDALAAAVHAARPDLAWNLPERNPFFTGRADDLARLHAALHAGQPAALTQALRGLGGVGKSQLALEYAWRHAADYDTVYWLRAESETTLAPDLAALAAAWGLADPQAQNQAEAVDAALTALAQRKDWLLVYDNAQDPDSLRPFLPRPVQGHVVITTRHAHWGRLARALDVPVLPPDEAAALLRERSGDTDRAAALKLAEALGYLPLALEQAGAYCAARGIGLAGYQARFQDAALQAELLRLYQPEDYPDVVAGTWALAFADLDPAATALLRLCAYLDPDAIPLDLLAQAAQDEAVEWPDPALRDTLTHLLRLDAAVEGLRHFSLVTRTGDNISVHRLVQAVTRHALADADRRAWAACAAGLVNAVFPGDVTTNVNAWPVCDRLLAHAQAAAQYAEGLGAASEQTGRLLNQAGLYLIGRARYAEARAALARAIAIVERVYGPDHPDVATLVNNLGRVLQDLGDLPAARAALERALAIGEVVYGKDHPQVAIYVNNLGGVLRDLGDLPAARAAFARALAIDERVYGPDHPEVAIDVNNLGRVLHDLGDLPAARAAFARALAIFERVLGPDHFYSQWTRENLAALGE